MNRAIAQLQSGELAGAKADYLALAPLIGEGGMFRVYYGLGEVAYRQGDKADALKHYEAYLKVANAEAVEYQEIQSRVELLKAELARQ